MSSEKPAEANPDLLHSMYEQLRTEIGQRLDLRQSILTFTLLVAASLFGLGLQTWVNGVTVLCYPILAFFLACVWEQHDEKIGQIAAFLRQIEDDHLGSCGPGWEQWRRQRFKAKNHHIEIPAKGIFLASEALALLIGVARLTEQQVSIDEMSLFILLFVVDSFAIVLTVIVLKHHRER